jgi:hypothetical protein
MLEQRRTAAEQVAAGLIEAELAIDAALNKTAALAAVLPIARSGAGLSALYGQEAMERLTETMAALAQARRGIVETHKQLAEVRDQIGLGPVMGGDDSVKPPKIGADGPRLRAVPNGTGA